MKVKEFPFMRAFCSGAFSANSGGTLDSNEDIKGTPEEWAEAEKWLEEYTLTEIQCLFNISGNTQLQLRLAGHLGGNADEGQTICGQFYQEEGSVFSQPTDDVQKAGPYIILDRYY